MLSSSQTFPRHSFSISAGQIYRTWCPLERSPLPVVVHLLQHTEPCPPAKPQITINLHHAMLQHTCSSHNTVAKSWSQSLTTPAPWKQQYSNQANSYTQKPPAFPNPADPCAWYLHESHRIPPRLLTHSDILAQLRNSIASKEGVP